MRYGSLLDDTEITQRPLWREPVLLVTLGGVLFLGSSAYVNHVETRNEREARARVAIAVSQTHFSKGETKDVGLGDPRTRNCLLYRTSEGESVYLTPQNCTRLENKK